MVGRLITPTIYIVMRHLNLRVYHPYRPFSSPILSPCITQEFQYLPFISPRMNYRSARKQAKNKKTKGNNCVTGSSLYFGNLWPWTKMSKSTKAEVPSWLLIALTNSGCSLEYIKYLSNHLVSWQKSPLLSQQPI